MRRKKKLSSKILASTSWQKNYVTMMELRNVEEELEESYKAQRLKEEKQAIKTIKRNPRYFYKYAKKFSKNNGDIAAFVKEDGELTDDAFEKSEILRSVGFYFLQIDSKIYKLSKIPEQNNVLIKFHERKNKYCKQIYSILIKLHNNRHREISQNIHRNIIE